MTTADRTMHCMGLYMLVLFAVLTPPASANGVIELSSIVRTKIEMPSAVEIRTTIRDQIATTLHGYRYELASGPAARLRFGMRIGQGMTVTLVRYRLDSVWHVAVTRRADSSGGGPVGGSTNGGTLEREIGTQGFILPFTDSIVGPRAIDIEVTVAEILQYGSGALTYDVPFDLLRRSSTTAIDWSVDARMTFPIHDVVVAPADPRVVVTDTSIMLTRSGTTTAADLHLSMHVRLADMRLAVLSYKPKTEDGYALMLGLPRNADDQDILPKRFTMVIDHSGSMSGVKMQQAKEAALYCVGRLRVRDEVNVIAFDDKVVSLYQTPKAADAEAIGSCQTFIQRLAVAGGTDITRAMRTALVSYTDTAFVNVIIFITDGISPIDYAGIRAQNTMKTRVFVVGIGSDVNEEGLRRLAVEHRGAYTAIKMAGNVTDSVAALYRSIKDPLIKNPSVSVGPLAMYDMLPLSIPDIYVGEQFALAGRYAVSGDVSVRIAGTGVDGLFDRSFPGRLADSEGDGDPVVPKFWARMRVDALLELMSKEAPNSARWQEWRDEIIRLGLTYGVLTPYTSFAEGPRDGGPTDVRETSHVEALDVRVSPNPARGRTTISMDVDTDLMQAEIDIVSMDGQIVRHMTLTQIVAGAWTHDLELVDASGAPLPPGVYVVIVRAGTFRRTARIVVLRN